MHQDLVDVVNFLHAHSIPQVKTGIILGSGLGSLAERVGNSVKISVEDIPHYPLPTVTGHGGNLVFGRLAGRRPVLIIPGRVHYYEGCSSEEVTFAVRLMAALGIKLLITTNAAGAINKRFRPGELMLVTDQINLMFRNPLIGPGGKFGYNSIKDSSLQSFRKTGNPSTRNDRGDCHSEIYSSRYFPLIRKIAGAKRIKLRQGVLCGVCGPNYETAAEVRMLGRIGADAVSMSMIPEVLAARQLGMEVIGISCLTNMAAGISRKRLSHDEVVSVAGGAGENMSELIRGIIGGNG